VELLGVRRGGHFITSISKTLHRKTKLFADTVEVHAGNSAFDHQITDEALENRTIAITI
jgi:hypothetical protein